MKTKQCSKCNKQFQNNRHGRICNECRRKVSNLWKKNNPTKAAEHTRRVNQSRKIKVLNYYCLTDKLQCNKCGFKDTRALCLDHINNDGFRQRKIGITGTAMYLWVIKNNFPKGFQVLCANCNLIKEIEFKCQRYKVFSPHANINYPS